MSTTTAPSATINPDYLGYLVELDSGKILTGVLNGSTDNELKIADQSGTITTVPRKQVVSMTPSQLSVMPEKLLERLTPGERKDLLTFLLTQRPSGSKP